MPVGLDKPSQRAMEEFLKQFVDGQVLENLKGVTHTVVFVNFETQYVCSKKSDNINIVGVSASEPVDGDAAKTSLEKLTFYGRHISYNIPQLPFWRPPPLLSQLYIIKSLGVGVNPHRHFLCPSVVDLAMYMWESGATSLDVFTESQSVHQPQAAFRFELTYPMKVVTGKVSCVKWHKVSQSVEDKLVLPVQYTNTMYVQCDGYDEEVTVQNVAHSTVKKRSLGLGAVVKLVVVDAIIPCAKLLLVEQPGKRPRMPRSFRWVDGKCCLPVDMERAVEMRHACLRLGMPTSVPPQLFMVLHTANVKNLHPLLVTKTPILVNKDLGRHKGHTELCKWVKELTLTLPDIMHCSSAFEPEWGLLRLAIMCNWTGAKSDPAAFYNSWKLGKDYPFVRSRWKEFESFLNRHDLWTAAVDFDTATFVEPLPVHKHPFKKLKDKKRRREPRQGIAIGDSTTCIAMHSDKPLPSPPNDLSCPC